MLDGMTPSEEEQSSDDGGLPKVGRAKKKPGDSDSDFQVEEDSGSDWEEKPSKKQVRRFSWCSRKLAAANALHLT